MGRVADDAPTFVSEEEVGRFARRLGSEDAHLERLARRRVHLLLSGAAAAHRRRVARLTLQREPRVCSPVW